MKTRLKDFAVISVILIIVSAGIVSASALKKEPAKDEPAGNEDLAKIQDPGLYFLLAEEAESQGDTKKVLDYFKKALALDPGSAYLNTRIGQMRYRNRRLADALIMAELAAIFDPNYEDAFELLGKVNTVTGSRTRAIEDYSRSLEIKPDQKNIYTLLGGLQLHEERLSDAEKTFQKMIEQFPDDRDVYFFLGKVYLENHKYQQAIKVFEDLLSRQTDSAALVHVELGNIYARQKDYAQAETHLRKAVELNSYNIEARIALGRVLANNKKYTEAYNVFEEAAKLAPSFTRIQIEMALVLSAEKQFDKARDILDKILKEKPGFDQVRFYLGRVMREQGKFDEAEQEFAQIQKGSPIYSNSRVLLALMFLKSKDLAKAMKYVDEAIETDAKDPDLYHIRGSVLEELHRFDEALKTYQKALETDPGNIRLRYSLGNVYEKSGRRNQAMAEMEGILKDKPDDAGSLNFIGYTLLVTGKDVARAEQLIKKASELEPDDGYIKDSVAWMLHKQGKHQEALDVLKTAISKIDADPIIYDHLGDVYNALGRKDDAEKAYRKSLEVNTENQVVSEKIRKLEQEKGAGKK